MRTTLSIVLVVASAAAASAQCQKPGPRNFGIGASTFVTKMKAAGEPVRLNKACQRPDPKGCEITFIRSGQTAAGDFENGCFAGLVTTTVRGEDLQAARRDNAKIVSALLSAVGAEKSDRDASASLADNDTAAPRTTLGAGDHLQTVRCCAVATSAWSSTVVTHFFRP